MLYIEEDIVSNKLENIRRINFPAEVIRMELLGPKGYLEVGGVLSST